MQVSGKVLKDTFGKGSDEDHGLLCEPCRGTGRSVIAKAYCKDCSEYFCGSCLDFHQKLSATKKHTILQGLSMPKSASARDATKTDTCKEPCDRHSPEIIRFYCLSHDAMGCGDCMVLDHKTCSVSRIQDISKEYAEGAEVKGILKNIDVICGKLSRIKNGIEENEKVSDETYSKALHDIRATRKKLNDHFDQVENTLITHMDEVKKNDRKLIEKLKLDEKSMKKEMQDSRSQIQKQMTKANELFVTAKRAKAKVARMNTRVEQLQQENKIKTFRFERSEMINTILSSNETLGTLKYDERRTDIEKKIAEMDAEYEGEIDMKTAEDKKDCCIVGSAMLSRDKVVVADWVNTCIKLIGIKQGNVMTRYSLQGCPVDVAVVSENQIAVTLRGEQKITILTLTDDNKLKRSQT